MSKKFRLALDWTPNVNHIGFLIGMEKAYFNDMNIDLEIIDPEDDNYELTPAKKVELGKADAALCPTESLISYRSKKKPFPLKAVAAIYRSDVSAICTLGNSNINSPKALDGKIYASYQARYEDHIVRQMIKNDGGNGDIQTTYPDKLGIWNTLLKGEADATWIFTNWEGVQATSRKVELNYFKMSDHDIPYSYSPVIAIDEDAFGLDKSLYRDFIKATKKGFLQAKKEPADAARILEKYVPEHDKDIDLESAIRFSADHMEDVKDWGKMRIDQVSAFLEWINDNGLEQKRFTADEIVTNELLT